LFTRKRGACDGRSSAVGAVTEWCCDSACVFGFFFFTMMEDLSKFPVISFERSCKIVDKGFQSSSSTDLETAACGRLFQGLVRLEPPPSTRRRWRAVWSSFLGKNCFCFAQCIDGLVLAATPVEWVEKFAVRRITQLRPGDQYAAPVLLKDNVQSAAQWLINASINISKPLVLVDEIQHHLFVPRPWAQLGSAQ
jgi:hypothetical protein